MDWLVFASVLVCFLLHLDMSERSATHSLPSFSSWAKGCVEQGYEVEETN